VQPDPEVGGSDPAAIEDGGRLQEPRDIVRTKASASIPGASIDTEWTGPAKYVILWVLVISEIIVGGTWIMSNWVAGVCVEVMALIVIGIWFATERRPPDTRRRG